MDSRAARLRERLALWSRPIVYLGRNPITLTGTVLTTSAGLTLVAFWVLEVVSGRPIHPYAGIVFFLALPTVFTLGLVLMPLGAWRRRRSLRRRGELPHDYPHIDLGQPVLRKAVMLVGAATVANVMILGVGSYRGIEYLDSNQFCGLTCHTVMAPEYAGFAESPHSRVGCVQCHIGPGASWFVRSKLSGVRQVVAVSLGTYSRPIPSPVRELRPARETCEQCHWPRKFHGDKLLVRAKYSDDEANTRLLTVLTLKIGGQEGRGATGIHGRHLDERERIRYVTTDGRRQVIPRVSYLDDSGRTVEYVSAEPGPDPPGGGEQRAMDCMDCHNRPTHAFELPERAVDRALEDGRISASLPFVRKTAVELLRADYPDRQTAQRRIEEGMAAFYRERYPAIFRDRRALVEAAARELLEIYRRNVFPDMRVTWGTYPNNIGHEDFAGCFRCHDDKHKSADGRVITQECDACHSVLAMEENSPRILSELGLQ